MTRGRSVLFGMARTPSLGRRAGRGPNKNSDRTSYYCIIAARIRARIHPSLVNLHLPEVGVASSGPVAMRLGFLVQLRWLGSPLAMRQR